MKYYQMDCDAHENPDMKKLIHEWGWDWYGRYWAILGMVGQQVTEGCQTFKLQTNDGRPFPVRLLANDLGTNVERMTNFCRYLAKNHLIDNESWKSKKLIYVPKLEKRADEYTKKLRRNSGQTPDKLRLEEKRVKENKKQVTSDPANAPTPTYKMVLTDNGPIKVRKP